MASSNSTYDAQASTNYKEAFALFDKRGTQRVALDSLGDLLRACGQNPTLAEIRELEKNIGGDCMFPSILYPSSFHPTHETHPHRGSLSFPQTTTTAKMEHKLIKTFYS